MTYPNLLDPGDTAPAFGFFAVTPSDTTTYPINTTNPTRPRGLYVGVAGNVALQDDAGVTVTFVGVPAGFVLPVRPLKVMATGTTATNIIALV